ncbi:phospholipase D-like domain-containing protein [Streptomyces sp. CA-294286]|uniref:phospholipase D-like domain-containing protein n=1 Tax=Streptomyces sp. CA-294286 TaxID=3240070 RepID=UPI003D8BA6D7
MQRNTYRRAGRMGTWGAGVVALALVAPVTAHAGVPGQAQAAVTTTATFNDPSGDSAAQSRIRDHVKGLIEGAPTGSAISAGLYSFTDTQISGALADAERRGVDVRIVIDNAATGAGGQYAALKAALGTDQSKGSYVTNCGVNRGCIGNRVLMPSKPDDGSINHNKFWLFSETGGSKNVVVQSSANMTSTQRTDYFNNAVTIVDAGLYGAYRGYFADLAKRQVNNDYYRTPTAGPYKTYFFPRKEAAGKKWNGDASTDTVSLILGNVDCRAGTEVRMAANLFSRREVAAKLVAMKSAGCKVILANDGGTSMSDDVSGIVSGKMTERVQCAENVGDRKVGLHSKYVLVNGTYDGKAGRKLVFTGSHNYSYSALRANDETLLKIDDVALYDQFRANHAKIMTFCKGS